MSWFDPTYQNLDQLFANSPQLAEDLSEFTAAIWQQPYVPATTLELCRLRLARMLGCESEWRRRQQAARAAGLSEEKLANLSNYLDDPDYSAAERACLAFAEVYAQDPQAISDEQAAAVVEHHGDAGLVLLVQALGLFNGISRMNNLFGLGDCARDGE